MEESAEVQRAFDLRRVAAQVVSSGFSRVALQFPDELLEDAVPVVESLKAFVAEERERRRADVGDADKTEKSGSEAPEPQLAVLGDTAYGSCCADEVAAAHVRADVVVHFGRSCLSRPSSVPVLFAFERDLVAPSTVGKLGAALSKSLAEASEGNEILVFLDQPYIHLVEELRSALQGSARVHFGTLPRQLGPSKPAPAVSQALDDAPEGSLNLCGYQFALDERIQGGDGEEGRTARSSFLARCDVLWVGEASGRSFLNVTYSVAARASSLCTIDPTSEALSLVPERVASANRQLMKRYYLVQRAKDADVFGVLVGTLSVDRYRSAIGHVQKLLRLAGKRFYTVAVGKVNVPKLANFSTIECFVSIACPLTSIGLGENSADAHEYLAPIITPYELEVALRRGAEWTGEYETDFSLLFDRFGKTGDDGDHGSSDEEPEAEVSLVSGRTILNPKNLANQRRAAKNEPVAAKPGALTLTPGAGEITTWSPAAAAFVDSKTSWKGLEPKIGETEVTIATQGRSGLPMGYTEDASAEEKR